MIVEVCKVPYVTSTETGYSKRGLSRLVTSWCDNLTSYLPTSIYHTGKRPQYSCCSFRYKRPWNIDEICRRRMGITMSVGKEDAFKKQVAIILYLFIAATTQC